MVYNKPRWQLAYALRENKQKLTISFWQYQGFMLVQQRQSIMHTMYHVSSWLLYITENNRNIFKTMDLAHFWITTSGQQWTLYCNSKQAQRDSQPRPRYHCQTIPHKTSDGFSAEYTAFNFFSKLSHCFRGIVDRVENLERPRFYVSRNSFNPSRDIAFSFLMPVAVSSLARSWFSHASGIVLLIIIVLLHLVHFLSTVGLVLSQ